MTQEEALLRILFVVGGSLAIVSLIFLVGYSLVNHRLPFWLHRIALSWWWKTPRNSEVGEVALILESDRNCERFQEYGESELRMKSGGLSLAIKIYDGEMRVALDGALFQLRGTEAYTAWAAMRRWKTRRQKLSRVYTKQKLREDRAVMLEKLRSLR